MAKGRGHRAGFVDVWRAVATEDGGRVIERRLRPPAVELHRGPWTARADLVGDPSGSGSTHTRLQAPYRAVRDFRLRIAKRGPGVRLAEWFGAGGIRIGRAEFDRRFHVRASSRGLARSLLLGTRLGERLLEHPDVRVDIARPGPWRRRALGPGVREAVIRVPRILREADELRAAFALAWELMEELARVGVAKPPPP